jgi:hypothetical protein
MSEDKVRTKDLCWSMGTIYDCWNLLSIARRPTRVNSGDKRVTREMANSSVFPGLSWALCGGIYRYLNAQRLVLRTHVPSAT